MDVKFDLGLCFELPRSLEAAKATGAEAIHPGFGFLSENAGFVKAVEDAGLVFIGPGADAIASMGDKITSKNIAEKAGVSTVPGTPDAIEDVNEAARMAEGIGYPVMIKAPAGGGGRGDRRRDDRRGGAWQRVLHLINNLPIFPKNPPCTGHLPNTPPLHPLFLLFF